MLGCIVTAQAFPFPEPLQGQMVEQSLLADEDVKHRQGFNQSLHSSVYHWTQEMRCCWLLNMTMAYSWQMNRDCVVCCVSRLVIGHFFSMEAPWLREKPIA